MRTLEGLRPIEALRVGDQVLSQNTETGRLSFAPVLAVFHNKPAPTFRITLDETGDSVVATGIHRFWKAGQGWTMSRDLKPGDRIRLVGASAAVESVEPGAMQPVYNLEVEGSRDFFVGERGALVHDSSFVQPVEAPFDGLASAR